MGVEGYVALHRVLRMTCAVLAVFRLEAREMGGSTSKDVLDIFFLFLFQFSLFSF